VNAGKPPPATQKPPVTDQATVAALETEFESALRGIEAAVDQRLLTAAEERQALEAELDRERATAAAREAEAAKLRKQMKQLTEALANSESDLKQFEQGLEAVEDGFDEQLRELEERLDQQRADAEQVNTSLAEAVERCTELERQLAAAQDETRVTRERLEGEAAAAQEEMRVTRERLQGEAAAAQEEARRLREELEGVRSTLSWRATAPLRRVPDLFRSKDPNAPDASS
jgi:chromosome segregation ATPase